MPIQTFSDIVTTDIVTNCFCDNHRGTKYGNFMLKIIGYCGIHFW